jgi:hypothetical protein
MGSESDTDSELEAMAVLSEGDSEEGELSGFAPPADVDKYMRGVLWVLQMYITGENQWWNAWLVGRIDGCGLFCRCTRNA